MEFAEFYRETSPRLLRYAYGLTGDRQQAQDVTQEAYVRAWQRWSKVCGYDNREAWLRLVVNRLVQDWRRHLRVRRTTRIEEALVAPAPSDDTVLVTTALRALPKAQRQALALHYLLDMPIAQIAAETGATEGTVKSWLSRGRSSLAERLQVGPDAELDAEAPAREGARRQRRRTAAVVTAAALAVIVVVGIAAVLSRPARHPQPAGPTPTQFHSLRQIGQPLPLPAADTAVTAIGDGRGYVAGVTPDMGLSVQAVDLGTGAPLWTQPGPGFGGPRELVVLPDAVIAILVNSTPQGEISWKVAVFDPATGAVLWQVSLRDPDSADGERLLYYREAAVITDTRTGAVRAVDWRTGRVRWTLSDQRSVFGVHYSADLAGPQSTGDGGFARPYSDGRLLGVDGSGTITEYAVTTGTPTGRSWAGLPGATSAEYVAYEGKVYMTTDTQLGTIDLGGGTGPQATYTAKATPISPVNPKRLHDVIPCGVDAVCVLDGDLGLDPGDRVDVVMIRGEQVVAKVVVDQAIGISPIGDHVAVEGEQPVLLDDRLRRAASGLQKPYFLRIGPGAALAVDSRGDHVDLRRSAYGIDLATGRMTALGALADGLGMPAIDGTHLLVTAGSNLYVYSFAEPATG